MQILTIAYLIFTDIYILQKHHYMLKKLTLFLAAICIAASAFAQKGTWLLEVNGLYDHHKINNDGGTTNKPVSLANWNIAINAGYQFNKHWTVGILGGYGEKDFIDWVSISSGSSTTYWGEKTRAKTWAIGAFGRYTYPINNWLFVYGQTEIIKFGDDYKVVEQFDDPPVAIPSDYAGTPQAGNGVMVHIYPAVGMNLVNGYGIDMSIGGINYQHLNGFYINDNQLKITLGQQFNFGIHKFIGWKKANGLVKDPLSN